MGSASILRVISAQWHVGSLRVRGEEGSRGNSKVLPNSVELERPHHDVLLPGSTGGLRGHMGKWSAMTAMQTCGHNVKPTEGRKVRIPLLATLRHVPHIQSQYRHTHAPLHLFTCVLALSRWRWRFVRSHRRLAFSCNLRFITISSSHASGIGIFEREAQAHPEAGGGKRGESPWEIARPLVLVGVCG